MMKIFLALAVCTALTSALSTGYSDQSVLHNAASADRFLIELGPGDTRWISEDDKWELRRVCCGILKAIGLAVSFGKDERL